MPLHVSFHVVERGGRKEMQLREGATPSRRTDKTLVKALARAFRWKLMLEFGEFATIADQAEREGIAPSYMTRVLRLISRRSLLRGPPRLINSVGSAEPPFAVGTSNC